MKKRRMRFVLWLSMFWCGMLFGQGGLDMLLEPGDERCNQLVVKIRPGEAMTGNYSAGIFSIRYPESMNGTLSLEQSVFGYQVSAQGTGNDGYRYVAFSFAQTNFISWQGGSAYTAALLTFEGGPTSAVFELVSNVTWTNEHNGNYYQELGGLEHPGVLENRVAAILGLEHQVQLACLGQLNITLGADCTFRLMADNVLTGEFRCLTNEHFEILVMDDHPDNGFIIDGPGLYTYTVSLIDDLPFAVSFSTCWGLVLAEDKSLPQCIPPPDTVLSCIDLPVRPSQLYPGQLDDLAGSAWLTDNCQGVQLLEEIAATWSTCGGGLIQRTFQAVDASGNDSDGVCRQTIQLIPASHHDIRFPADELLNYGDSYEDSVYYQSEFCRGLTLEIRDDTLWDLSACRFMIEREFRLMDLCVNGVVVEVSRDEDCDGMEGEEAVWVLVRGDSVYVDRDSDFTNADPMTGAAGLACWGVGNPQGYWRSISSAGIGGWMYRQQIQVVGLCCDGVDGIVATEEGLGVPGVEVVAGVMTDYSGGFALGWSGSNVSLSVRPYKDNFPMQGVSVMDIILIQRHILGVVRLSSPYKMIAADVNRSGTITTLDIIQMQRLILGVVSGFPGNTSWRFIPQSYVFPDPEHPWLEVFPEGLDYTCNQGTQFILNFIALKIGDVNGSSLL
jgi:hypothetical protein